MNAQSLSSFLYKRGAILDIEDDDLLVDAPEDVLSDEILSLIRQHKAEIIALVRSLDAEIGHDIEPVKLPRPPAYECAASLAQQRMLFMEELAGNSSYYNIPIAYKIVGRLDKPALVLSFTRLVAAHDILRSVYVQMEHAYIQRVCEPAALNVIETCLPAEGDQDKCLDEVLRQEASHVFDLAHEWPIRVALIALGNEVHVLSINIHHIAADGWSARKVISELGAGYALCRNASNVGELPAIERSWQYADYVAWQEVSQHSASYQGAKDYWIKVLHGMPQLHSLLTDFTRPSVQSVSGRTYTHSISPPLSAAVGHCTRDYRTTPFVIFQSVFAALLARYSGEDDIVFGTAAANRQPTEFVDAVGLFVNTLVLRYAVPDNISFADLIKQAIEVSDGAFRHQQTPFDVLVDELQPVRSLGYSPLVQVMLVMQENAAGQLELDGTNTYQLQQRQDVSKFDIALHVHANKGAVRLDWEYNTSLFKPETIQAMARHFERLLHACLFMPEREIGSISLVEERSDLAAIDETDFPDPVCIHRLFESQAALHPDAIAVTDGQRRISYRELDRRASHVAGHLHRAGVGTAGRVGLCMEKSADLIVGLLAILKIGAVYVPLDPHYPQERLEFMMRDSGMGILLASSKTSLPAGLKSLSNLLFVDALDDDDALPYPVVTDVNLPAYIIYTSGSTGKPKGVLVSHKALFHSLHANNTRMEMTSADVMPTIGSQAFGVSLLEILLPLTVGGAVQMLNKQHIADLDKLMEETDQVTVLHAVPSLMQQWLDAVIATGRDDRYPRLRLLLIGGEPVSDGLLKKIKQWRPGVRLLELYGMTESTVVCCSYEAGAGTSAHYCIGKPHSNVRFHVLNRQCREQPVGVPGELHIGGLSIAAEYINQPEMTAEKFIDNPFVAGERLYKTGDLVRLLHDGNYEFLGRVDHQVSLRGFRIEMGEIENALKSHDEIKDAVVVVKEFSAGDQRLVAYVVTRDTESAAPARENEEAAELRLALIARLRQHLGQSLPDYMVPATFVLLERLPLTPNGKLDRKGLPMPDVSQLQVRYVAPANEMESKLCTIWENLLGIDKVSVHDNFFSIGGDSISSTKVVLHARKAGIYLSAQQLFEFQTIHELAQHASTSPPQKGIDHINHDSQTGLDEPYRYHPLPANRHWYFKRTIDLHEWGASIWLEFSEPSDYQAVTRKTVEHIQGLHDGLRLQLVKEDGQWRERIASVKTLDAFHVEDLSSLSALQKEMEFNKKFESYKTSIDFSQSLFKAVYFRMGGDQGDRIILVMHHIAMDLYSFDIFMADFYETFYSLKNGQTPAAGIGQASLAEWANAEQRWANSEQAADSTAFWLGHDFSGFAALPTDFEYTAQSNSIGSSEDVTATLSAGDTELFLSFVKNSSFSMLHVLMTCLVEGFHRWTGKRSLGIELVGGGRDSLTKDLDLSATIGWLNEFIPIFIDLDDAEKGESSLQSASRAIDQCMAYGKGFNALKYHVQDGAIREVFAQIPEPEFAINFIPPALNQTSKAANADADLRFVRWEWMSGAQRERVHLLGCEIAFAEGQLRFSWNFSKNVYRAGTIETLAACCVSELLLIVKQASVQTSETALDETV